MPAACGPRLPDADSPAQLGDPSSRLWRGRVGQGRWGPRRVGLLLRQLPPPQSIQLLSCYLCSGKAQLSSWKRCLLPRLSLGPGLGLSLPAGGSYPSHTVWEQVGGRASHSLPLCGPFGSQHQPGREALGSGREPLRRASCGPLLVGDMARGPDLGLAGFE